MFILLFLIFFQDMLVKSLLELFPTWPQPSSVKCLKWKFSQVKNLIMSFPTWECQVSPMEILTGKKS